MRSLLSGSIYVRPSALCPNEIAGNIRYNMSVVAIVGGLTLGLVLIDQWIPILFVASFMFGCGYPQEALNSMVSKHFSQPEKVFGDACVLSGLLQFLCFLFVPRLPLESTALLCIIVGFLICILGGMVQVRRRVLRGSQHYSAG